MVSHSVWMQKKFFYNKDIFNELGLEVPETWDQFIEVLDKIKASGMDPIAEGNQDKWPSAHYIGALNEQLVDDETRAKDYNPKTGEFTDPGYAEALEKLPAVSILHEHRCKWYDP